MKKSWVKISLMMIVGLGLLLVDLWTKHIFYGLAWWAEKSFLEPVFNLWVSWGIALPRLLIVVVAIFAIGLFVWMYIKKYFTWRMLAFLLAGTLGNLLDRLILWGVRDFVSIGNFPVFNAADVFLNVGVRSFVLWEVLKSTVKKWKIK